jgi:glycerol-3-phosphate dehydrogenase (NAD(P)+)
MLAQNKSLQTILKELGHVAEGVATTREVYNLARELGVEMPIVRAVYQVLHENIPPLQAVEALLDRAVKPENHH